uniref:Uncharacterized protein n=1 Tax=Caenorhabditis tropicalis TaxID=1561998 RepID=A0A1I7U9V0_9PELO
MKIFNESGSEVVEKLGFVEPGVSEASDDPEDPNIPVDPLELEEDDDGEEFAYLDVVTGSLDEENKDSDVVDWHEPYITEL